MADGSKPTAVGVHMRDEAFAARAATKVTREVPNASNPYIAERVLWHGYDAIELAEKRSLVDVVFLLLKGELPTADQAGQLQKLLVLLANPGPRAPASRAVSAASLSKTVPEHWLPIGLALHGGEDTGAAAVRESIRFLRRHIRKDPLVVADALLADMPDQREGDCRPAPGFGSYYGGIDQFATHAAEFLYAAYPANDVLGWGMAFTGAMVDLPAGWLLPGVAAAVCVDLGLSPNAGAGLFQLAAAPGLLAQAIEVSGKPVTAAPFISDEDYHYEGAPVSDE